MTTARPQAHSMQAPGAVASVVTAHHTVPRSCLSTTHCSSKSDAMHFKLPNPNPNPTPCAAHQAVGQVLAVEAQEGDHGEAACAATHLC